MYRLSKSEHWCDLCQYHVNFDLNLDLEHTLDGGPPGDHHMQTEWQSSHLSGRSDLCKCLQMDRRTTAYSSLCLGMSLKKKPYSGKLGILPDHRRRWIEIPHGMVGGLPAVIISFKFHKNQLSCEGSKSGSSHYLGQWLIQQPVLPYRRDRVVAVSMEDITEYLFLRNHANQQKNHPLDLLLL